LKRDFLPTAKVIFLINTNLVRNMTTRMGIQVINN
jgi:hypothetical protein